jgi:gluconate 2-dehydrogenase gamma chain
MTEHAKIRLELGRFLETHPPPEAGCWQLGKLLRCIHKHLFDPSLNVRTLRERCELRDNNISCRFKREMGIPLKDYIDRLRLKAAKSLIQHPDISSAAAAHAVGYRHLQTFYRAVRRRYGCTPAALRPSGQPERPATPTAEAPRTAPNASTASDPSPPPSGGLSEGERRTLAAAMERVLPGEAGCPGAEEARAIAFFDWLAVQPSFAEAQVTLRAGIALLDSLSRVCWDAPFADCGEVEQDAVLRQVQEIPHATARRFFAVLVRVTIAGFLSPPAYGGNHDGSGWRFIGLPDGSAPKAAGLRA